MRKWIRIYNQNGTSLLIPMAELIFEIMLKFRKLKNVFMICFIRTWWRRLWIYNPLSYFLPRRYGIATLAFLGFCNVYSLRVNLSVAIVAMTPDEMKPERIADFDWDRKLQGLLLSSFFYGYIVTQIPGGWLASRFGGKKVFGYGILVSSILCLITPLATSYGGAPALMVVRILQGLAEVININLGLRC
jgi:hypothetical protein